MMTKGLAQGIDENASEAVNSAKAMTNELNSAFDDLGADLNNVPTNFNVSTNANDVRPNVQAANGVTIQLSIDNFNKINVFYWIIFIKKNFSYEFCINLR